LNDTIKTLSIFFLIDLYIGFHSPYNGELIISSFYKDFGLVYSNQIISGLVFTFPIIFYIIFKHLIKIIFFIFNISTSKLLENT
jgi:hypothetical protein